MIVHLEELSNDIQTFMFEEKPEAFPPLVEMNQFDDCTFNHPVDIRLGAKRMGELVTVEGKFSAGVEMTCNRCLKKFESTLASRFNLTYASKLPLENGPDEDDDIELQAEELGLLLFQGEAIDLRDAIQSEIVMAIPMQPLCSEDCKGLCPKCGNDLNLGECGCQRKTVDPRFAALKNLKVKK